MFGGGIGLIGLICAIWVIYDVISNQKKMKDENKILWIVAAIIFSIITAIVYYFVVKKESVEVNVSIKTKKKKAKKKLRKKK